jgi:hypothetical protein
MTALCISASDDACHDVLAELQFEGRRMSTVGTSGRRGAFSMQGPSSVSDLQHHVVRPMGFTQNRGSALGAD